MKMQSEWKQFEMRAIEGGVTDREMIELFRFCFFSGAHILLLEIQRTEGDQEAAGAIISEVEATIKAFKRSIKARIQ
jgi:hypothetical protein